ncbi:hypothetical protein I79_021750 [Cricetulus griseus]|uniref:Uncharacterized protein n=1 Tax=Cricetulus griseus TaxID=10029 RepID=G3IDH0_CRIGR|nr:hypothetical protein I79_021750 [Cricetulus griseus]
MISDMHSIQTTTTRDLVHLSENVLGPHSWLYLSLHHSPSWVAGHATGLKHRSGNELKKGNIC